MYSHLNLSAPHNIPEADGTNTEIGKLSPSQHECPSYRKTIASPVQTTAKRSPNPHQPTRRAKALADVLAYGAYGSDRTSSPIHRKAIAIPRYAIISLQVPR
jgi:hypothetical protein